VRAKPVLIPMWMADLPVWNQIWEAFVSLAERPLGMPQEEFGQADRRSMDSALLIALGLSESALDDVYDAILDACHARLAKSASA